ncbi:protein RKD1-like [Ipomoea triloba]|uniref:protein RKD1-like n=1 Tax=Ipomoea triloba TaxID=35885 RepID=UPI00125D5379|nr:protein RKD1-like [Ipomoea triloba]
MANQASFPYEFAYTTYDIARYSLWDETTYPASSSSFPNKIVDPSSDITGYSFSDELVDPTPSSSLPNHISYPSSDVIEYPLWIDMADVMNQLSTEENVTVSTSGILVEENAFLVANNATVGGNIITDSVVVEMSMIETLAHRQRKNTRRTFCDSSTISKEMISKYFHLPIYRAAKELRVGYTILKERCRELGIFKWPYRQLVSLEKLSGKVQVFSNIENDPDIKEAVKELKSRREMLLSVG